MRNAARRQGSGGDLLTRLLRRLAEGAATRQYAPLGVEAKRDVRLAQQHAKNVPGYFEDYRARLASIDQTNQQHADRIAAQQAQAFEQAAGHAAGAGANAPANAAAGLYTISADQMRGSAATGAGRAVRDFGVDRQHANDTMAGLARVSAGDEIRATAQARDGVRDARARLAALRAERGGFATEHMARTERDLRDQQLAAAALELDSRQFDARMSADWAKAMLGYQATLDTNAARRESDASKRKSEAANRRNARRIQAMKNEARAAAVKERDGTTTFTFKDGRRLAFTPKEVEKWMARKNQVNSLVGRASQLRRRGYSLADARKALSRIIANRQEVIAVTEIVYGGKLSAAGKQYMASTFVKGAVPGGYY